MISQHYKNQKGFTLFEMVLALSVFAIMTSLIILYVNPEEKRKIARDNLRISDAMLIDRLINEYRLDNGSYPDVVTLLRDSRTLPTGGISIDNSTSGWIDADFSKYNSRLPIDPINSVDYFYSYYHSVTGYELNVILEQQTELMAEDGGNDPNRYEIGNDLSLISP